MNHYFNYLEREAYAMSHHELEEFKPQLLQLAINNTYMLVVAINYTKDSYTVIHSTTPLINTDQEGLYSLFSIGYLAMFHPDDRLNYPLLGDFDTLVEHLSNNNGSYTFEFRFQTSLTEYHWYEGTYVKQDASNASNINLLLLVKDIDEKKRIEETLKDALGASIISAKAKSTFFSQISQDIRTPLNVIAEMTDVIYKNIDNTDKIIESLNKIEVSSKYLTHLIDNILDMSEIEAGQILIAHVPFNFLDLLHSIELIYAEKAKAKGVYFNLQYARENCLHLVGDQKRVSHVLGNLLSIALKFAPAGSDLSFYVSLDKVVYNRAFYSFIVDYTGDDIAGEVLDQIFNPFSKEKTLQEEIIDEASLGLSLCKNIIELLGGHISVHSNDKEGGIRLEINISFELSEKSDMIKELPSSVKELDTSSPKTVLIVEANYSTYGIIRALLQSRGLTVDLAINGLDAVEIFEASKEGQYDLILMNIELPVMTGLDAARAIRNSSHTQSQAIPIIAMTANTFSEDLAEAISAGITDTILKPINATKLFSTITNYL